SPGASGGTPATTRLDRCTAPRPHRSLGTATFSGMVKAVPHVLIIGATSAIAGALAERYAQQGCRLHLIGRNPDKLAQLSARLGQAEVSSETADFTDHSNNERLVERAIQALGHIDLVFIVHGLLGDQLETERDFRAAEA